MPVLPERLQHREPRSPVLAFDHPHKALVDQRAQCLDHVELGDRGCSLDRLRDVGEAGVREDREQREHGALVIGEEGVAPLDRAAEGLLPRREVARAAREHLVPLLELGSELVDGEDLHSCCGKLEGEWQAVEPEADSDHMGGVLRGDHERRACGGGPLDEEPAGLGLQHGVGRDR